MRLAAGNCRPRAPFFALVVFVAVTCFATLIYINNQPQPGRMIQTPVSVSGASRITNNQAEPSDIIQTPVSVSGASRITNNQAEPSDIIQTPVSVSGASRITNNQAEPSAIIQTPVSVSGASRITNNQAEPSGIIQTPVSVSGASRITNNQAQHGGVLVPGASHIRIISWNPMFVSYSGRWFREGMGGFANCTLPEGATCEYHHDRSRYDSSDVILFTGIFLKTRDLPRSRRTNQTWVFVERETPINTRVRVKLNPFSTLFNVTETYASDADFVTPYGGCTALDSKQDNSVADYAANKTELVAWFVSHCTKQSERMHYARALQKHIPVHIYGECGNYSCPRTNASICNQMLTGKYWFYLGFENSLCKDYITEKFWKPFQLGIVPVVLGSADYQKFAPDHSYIDIRDFDSPKHLAEYLVYLSQNPEMYNSYFAWKDTHECGLRDKQQYPCQLCRFLHERMRSPRTKSASSRDVSKYWSPQRQCESVQKFRDNCNCWPDKDYLVSRRSSTVLFNRWRRRGFKKAIPFN